MGARLDGLPARPWLLESEEDYHFGMGWTRRGVGIPGAVRRLARDRARLVAILLLAVASLASSGIESAAAVTLQQTLNANWRGAYDILVTGKDADVGSSELLAPNALGSGDHGLTLAQLAQVRQVPGIDVAAPIGEVVLSTPNVASPNVTIPVGSSVAKAASVTPQAYDVTSVLTTDDGLGSRYVSTSSEQVVIDTRPGRPSRTVDPGQSEGCNFDNVTLNAKDWPHLCAAIAEPPPEVTTSDGTGGTGISSSVNGILLVSISNSVLTTERVTLVDPVAEKKLLGKAGSFLDPLEALPMDSPVSIAAMDRWAAKSSNPFTASFLKAQEGVTGAESAQQKAFEAEYKRFLKTHPKVLDTTINRYVPVLAASHAGASATARITIRALGAPSIVPDATSQIAPYQFPVPTTDAKELGTLTLDVSSALDPLLARQPSVPFPGTSPVAFSPAYNTLAFSSVGTSNSGTVGQVHGTAVSLPVLGYANPSAQPDPQANPFLLTYGGLTPGNESAYSSATPLKTPTDFVPPVGVSVGSLDTSALRALERSLSYVPLGAYQPVGATVRRDGVTTTLKPSLTGFGVVSSRTTAVASIYDASAWHQTAPVSAIRVRVAGISAYSPQAQQKVIRVAQAIDRLGMKATIVAGSSPSPVTVTVHGYAFGTPTATGTQTIGTLGNIRQDWSELGAAARAKVAVSAANLTVLGVGLGSAALLFGAIEFASVPRRRGQAVVFRESGWTRSRIRWWMAAEDLPAVALIIIAAGISTWLAGFSDLSLQVASIALGVVIVFSVLANALSSTQSRLALPGRTSSRRRTSRTPAVFGLRQVRVHRLAAGTQFVATLIVALAAAATTATFLHTSAAAGASLLAKFAVGQSSLPQVVLGAAGLISGVTLAVIARRLDLTARAPQWTALSAMGWTRANIRSAQIAETSTVAIPAALSSIVLTVLGGLLLHAGPILILGVVAAVAATAVTLAVAMLGGKTTP